MSKKGAIEGPKMAGAKFAESRLLSGSRNQLKPLPIKAKEEVQSLKLSTPQVQQCPPFNSLPRDYIVRVLARRTPRSDSAVNGDRPRVRPLVSSPPSLPFARQPALLVWGEL